MKIIKSILPFIMVLLCISCIIDTKPLGYSVRNCTTDTLYMYISDTKKVDHDIYMDKGIIADMYLEPDDTTVIYIEGEEKIISNYFRTLPDSISGADILPHYKDTCYLYVINWNILTKHSLSEINNNKYYHQIVITKNDFHNHIFDYTQDITGGK